jgi:C4-type Zn-finger protein
MPLSETTTVCPRCGFRPKDWGESCVECHYVERYFIIREEAQENRRNEITRVMLAK